jgi:hypothetical protein
MAKEYLKRHGACATATGFDNISYATILNIDNDLLVDFVSNCISSPYPPSVFVLTLLIALAKHGKDLHNVNSYRAVTLETACSSSACCSFTSASRATVDNHKTTQVSLMWPSLMSPRLSVDRSITPMVDLDDTSIGYVSFIHTWSTEWRTMANLSEKLKSLCGVLIGVPMSPMLWNIFMSTFQLLDDADDITRWFHILNKQTMSSFFRNA